MPGELIVAANVALLRATEQSVDYDGIAKQCFENNALIGAGIAGGATSALTDFRIHADGFSRFLILNKTMTPRQAGRMVQRLLEMKTYRILALMALPVARELSPVLLRSERELADISRSLIEADDAAEPMLFDKLTRLAAEIESTQSQNAHRFSAAVAYHGIVQRRIGELREERLPGLPTFQEFTGRHLGPAMDTCRSVSAQQDSLSTFGTGDATALNRRGRHSGRSGCKPLFRLRSDGVATISKPIMKRASISSSGMTIANTNSAKTIVSARKSKGLSLSLSVLPVDTVGPEADHERMEVDKPFVTPMTCAQPGRSRPFAS